MRRNVLITLAALFLVSPVLVTAPAQAASGQFATCKQLTKKYPKGIANSQMMADATGAKFNPALYAKNRKLDKDGDGVACWGVHDT